MYECRKTLLIYQHVMSSVSTRTEHCTEEGQHKKVSSYNGKQGKSRTVNVSLSLFYLGLLADAKCLSYMTGIQKRNEMEKKGVTSESEKRS